MPKKLIDFQKTVIYTISTGNSLYVGSTTNFTQRKNNHNNNISNENKKTYNLKLYKTIRSNGNEWDMQPHSKYPCNDKIEQTIEEQRIRILLNADLNMRSCGTGINYSELDRTEYGKQYYTVNKAKIIELCKQYKTENKAKIDEYQKQYRTENKAKIVEYQNQKVTCECGCRVTKYNLATHKKTKKHQRLIQSQIKDK